MKLPYLALLTSLICCSPTPSSPEVVTIPNAIVNTDYRMLVCHVDPSFDEEQQTHIRNAATAINLLTDRHVLISTPADLRFNDNATLSPCTITALTSEHRIVKAIQNRPEFWNVKVQGITSGQRIYIVTDRIQDGKDFHWIVVHEMGHALGMKDLPGTEHVMSGEGPFIGHWFDAADIAECQRAQIPGCQ